MQSASHRNVKAPLPVPETEHIITGKDALAARLADATAIPDLLCHHAVLRPCSDNTNTNTVVSDTTLLARAVHSLTTTHLSLHSGGPPSHPALLCSKQRLCTAQVADIFGTSRTPSADGAPDTLHSHREATHICLLVKGSLFGLTVIEENSAVPAEQLQLAIETAVQRANGFLESGLGEGGDIAKYTAQGRKEWGTVRAALLEDIRSREAVRCAESALFVVGIDDKNEGGSGPQWPVQAQSGSGSTRWYDNCLNVSVSDGSVALVFEESVCDSLALSWLANDLYHSLAGIEGEGKASGAEEVSERLLTHHPGCLSCAAVKNLEQEIRAREKQGLVHTWAERAMVRRAATASCPSNAHLLHKMKLDADAVVQVAAAIAYYKHSAKMPFAVHTVGMHRYVAGRNTGSVAACTPEVVACIKALCDVGPDVLMGDNDKAKLLLHAIATATARTKAVLEGTSPSVQHNGHVPHYTAERVWKPIESAHQFELYGTPANKTHFHFTYFLCNVEGLNSQFCFSFAREEFASYPEIFVKTMEECASVLALDFKRKKVL